ncbi:MAG TPA: CvpA family protein [Clostridiales bacterium]|nr:CvpA family protein [Clostridiales bacterium]
MNLLDAAILVILALSGIVGCYHGFILSLLNIGTYLVSFLLAFILYPFISKILIARTSLVDTLNYYIEVDSMLPDVATRKMPLDGLDPTVLRHHIYNAGLSKPFDGLLYDNATAEVFNQMQVSTLGDYFAMSLTNIVINIIGFFIVYFVSRMILTFILSIAAEVRELPMLRRYDTVAGFGAGVIRGLFIVTVIFALVSVGLTIMPLDIVDEIIQSSPMARFFIESNFITGLISNKI